MILRPARALLLALLAALPAAGCTAGEVTPPTTTPGTATTATPTSASPGEEAAVRRVFDGDTLLVSWEGAEEEVRLLGVNAPEQDECFGDQARRALSDLVADGTVRLDPQEERDQFGRLLAYAYAGGTLLNLALVEGGFALALQDDHPRVAEFLEADEQAYQGGLGLWAPGACGPAGTAVIALLEVEANPPGPDEDDLNGEWVLLENSGDIGADLAGWVLRDESSANRYLFPTGTILAPGEQAVVYTGCGPDGGGELYWCRQVPVWNNGGDTALLLDARGNVAGRLRYPG